MGNADGSVVAARKALLRGQTNSRKHLKRGFVPPKSKWRASVAASEETSRTALPFPMPLGRPSSAWGRFTRSRGIGNGSAVRWFFNHATLGRHSIFLGHKARCRIVFGLVVVARRRRLACKQQRQPRQSPLKTAPSLYPTRVEQVASCWRMYRLKGRRLGQITREPDVGLAHLQSGPSARKCRTLQ